MSLALYHLPLASLVSRLWGKCLLDFSQGAPGNFKSCTCTLQLLGVLLLLCYMYTHIGDVALMCSSCNEHHLYFRCLLWAQACQRYCAHVLAAATALVGALGYFKITFATFWAIPVLLIYPLSILMVWGLDRAGLK